MKESKFEIINDPNKVSISSSQFENIENPNQTIKTEEELSSQDNSINVSNTSAGGKKKKKRNNKKKIKNKKPSNRGVPVENSEYKSPRKSTKGNSLKWEDPAHKFLKT